MGKVIGLLFCITILFSCKKDKVFLCEGVSMSGDRSVFVGRWRWYKTRVTEWFDVGPDIVYTYTPQNQGFEYFFTMSQDGLYKGYKNNVLVHDLTFNNVDYESFIGGGDGMRLNVDCTSNQLELLLNVTNFSSDTVYLFAYPFDFYDEENQLKSNLNYFVRE